MFKFACDWIKLYGGDEYAMKAGGHEVHQLLVHCILVLIMNVA